MPQDSNESKEDRFESRVRTAIGFLYGVVGGATGYDAVVAINDSEAAIAGEALRRLGMKPNQDVMITGWDANWRTSPEVARSGIRPAVTVLRAPSLVGQGLVELVSDGVGAHEKLIVPVLEEPLAAEAV